MLFLYLCGFVFGAGTAVLLKQLGFDTILKKAAARQWRATPLDPFAQEAQRHLAALEASSPAALPPE